jgi:hypothetical protein
MLRIRPEMGDGRLEKTAAGIAREQELRPKKCMKPTLLSTVSVRAFSVLERIEASLVAQRMPQGGLCAGR